MVPILLLVMSTVLQGQYARSSGFSNKPIRVLTWNIGRGLNWAGITDFVSRLQPDLCIFQEVDLNAKRTGRRHLADQLAARFEFNYVFGVEFEELSQGSKTERAYHGQAVFARYPILAPRILRFSQQSDRWGPRWFLPRWPVFQPRRGGRMALVAELATGRTPMVVYDLHLESQEDDALRMWQLSEVVQDSLRYPADTPIIVAGDLNTRDMPSPLRSYLLQAGFRDACENGNCGGTKPNGQTLDWIFSRGPVVCSGTRVHREIRASDHFPLSTNLVLQ